jgi:hypothetical protein
MVLLDVGVIPRPHLKATAVPWEKTGPMKAVNRLTRKGLRNDELKRGGETRDSGRRRIYGIPEFPLFRVMPSFAMRVSNVVGLMARISAAPPAPRMRQPVS